MQIIVGLREIDEETINLKEEIKEKYLKEELLELLLKLKKDGYKIHSFYGKLKYDKRRKEIYDEGESGPAIKIDSSLVEYLFTKGNVKTLVIFANKRYTVFYDKTDIETKFTTNSTVRPLTLNKVLSNYDELIIKGSIRTLEKLYNDQYNFYNSLNK